MNTRPERRRTPTGLASELRTLADRVNDEQVAVFVDDAVYSAAQQLLDALEVMTEAADAERDLTGNA